MLADIVCADPKAGGGAMLAVQTLDVEKLEPNIPTGHR